MSYLCINQEEARIAAYRVNKSPAAAENLMLRLYKSNTALADGMTENSVTEADFDGYAAVELVANDWTITADAPTTIVAARKDFICTVAPGTPQTIYGYYLTTKNTGKMTDIWRFDDGPYTVTIVGDKISPQCRLNEKKPSEVT